MIYHRQAVMANVRSIFRDNGFRNTSGGGKGRGGTHHRVTLQGSGVSGNIPKIHEAVQYILVARVLKTGRAY